MGYAKWADCNLSYSDYDALPNEIVNRIFLGGTVAAVNEKVRNHFEIAHVVTVTNHVTCTKLAQLKGLQKDNWLYRPLEDKPNASNGETLPEEPKRIFMKAVADVEAFVQDALKNKDSKVLIHCTLGQNRSVAILNALFLRNGAWRKKLVEDSYYCSYCNGTGKVDDTEIRCKLCDAIGINKKNPHNQSELDFIASETYLRATCAETIVKDTMTRVQYKRKDAKVGEKNAYYQALVEIAEKRRPITGTKASGLQLATPEKSSVQFPLKKEHCLQKKLGRERIDKAMEQATQNVRYEI